MAYDLCLFDLDGTITESGEGIVKSVCYALKHFGIDVTDQNGLTKFIGPPLGESFRLYYGFSQEKVQAAMAKYHEYYSVTGMFENSVYDGIIELLEKLRADGVTLAVATAKPTVYSEKIAERFDFKKYFVLISGSGMDGTRSQKSEVISYALDKLDPAGQKRAVMIGDRKYDITGAKQTGVDSIGVLWGYGSRGELEEAGARRIARTTAELYDMLTGGTT
ncbi:MAG: HAD family hydrolase [Defluviitaleaceae bacterium]|nr:HAD family hydrolase [Defluviitaleaceae bacterium]MCL2835885.1 HAD family hydrolase [Defluviitaleaceae bacterium]